jgi:transcriptional regulator of acetoin/glycerol metabolism
MDAVEGLFGRSCSLACAASHEISGVPVIMAQHTMTPDTSLRETMRNRIVNTHRDTGGNLSETARRLGVSRNTIYRVIRVSAGHVGCP